MTEERDRKQVQVTFVGADDVLQHIVPLRERKLNMAQIKSATKRKRVSYALTIDDADSEDDDENSNNAANTGSNDNVEEDIQPLKASAALLIDEDGVHGGQVFGFKSVKKSSQMAKKAMESSGTATPSKDSATDGSNAASCVTPKSRGNKRLVKTPKSVTITPKSKQATTPKSILKKTPVAAQTEGTPTARSNRRLASKTPQRLWKRTDPGDDDVSSTDVSSSESSSSDTENCADDIRPLPATPSALSSNSGKRSSTVLEELQPSVVSSPVATTTSLATGATPTSGKRGRTTKSKVKDDYVETSAVESYFNQQSGPAVTSDRTLARLETPRLDAEQLAEALVGVKVKYAAEMSALVEKYRQQFKNWMFQMCEGYNLVLHGVGSKRGIVEEFRQTMLADYTHILVNGYFPGLTIKQILNAVTEDLLEHRGTFPSVVDQCDFIKTNFASGEYRDWFLVIHNIDGSVLRSEQSQVVLSLLAQVRGVHIVATVDHINAPLLWDQIKSSRFRWLWYDVTTFAHYTDETSYEDSMLVHQTGALALSSLAHVMCSLTSNARGIFFHLARYQLDHTDDPTYQGLPFPDLYQKCRESFLVNSELTLRTQLVEFRDHKLVRAKKGLDGTECLIIPLDLPTLSEYMEQQDKSVENT